MTGAFASTWIVMIVPSVPWVTPRTRTSLTSADAAPAWRRWFATFPCTGPISTATD